MLSGRAIRVSYPPPCTYSSLTPHAFPPNARGETRPEAGPQRTLAGVGCSRLFSSGHALKQPEQWLLRTHAHAGEPLMGVLQSPPDRPRPLR
jgi:hypothetical protein